MYKSFLVFLCIIGGYGREEDGVGTAERKAAWVWQDAIPS